MKEHYIVNENPVQMKLLISKHIRNQYPQYIIGILLIYIISECIPNFLGIFFPKSYLNTLAGLSSQFAAQLEQIRDVQSVQDIPIIVVVCAVLFNGVFILGRCLYLLFFLRNRSVEYGTIFDGFRFYFKSLGLYVVREVIIVAFMFCFVFPGIWAFYNYRQAFYILADDPKKGVIQCLKESREQMTGNRMNLFRVDLSYFLLVMITYFAGVMFSGYANADTTTAVGMALYYVCMLPFYMACGNMFLGQVTFYELLTSHGFKNFRFKGEDAFREGLTPPQM